MWEAEDLTLKRTVAVKLIQLSAQLDETAKTRFAREAQAAAGLAHPNLVTVHDFGVDDGIAYMVMEFLPGPDLAALLRSGGALPVVDALDYVQQAAAGLAAAHARGILHRDVKPANLMLTSTGSLKVVDFGIAAAADNSHDLTATGQVIGSLSYLAPERSMGSPASVQSDLYALGCVAVALLSGKPPFEGTTGQIILKHLNERPPRLTALRPGLPHGLDELIESLLAKEPSQRPRTADEVVDRLRRIRTQPIPAVSASIHGLAAASTVGRHLVGDAETVARPGATLRDMPVAGGGAATSVVEESATVLRLNPAPDQYSSVGNTHARPEDVASRRKPPSTPRPPAVPATDRRRIWWLVGAGLAAVAVLVISVVVSLGIAAQRVSTAGTPSTLPIDDATTSTRTSPPTSHSSDAPSEQPRETGLAQVPRVVTRFAAGTKAVGIALDGSRGRIYVASFGEGALVVLDAASGKRLAKVPVGQGTAGLAFDEARGAVHLQNVNTGSVVTVNIEGYSRVGTIAAGDGEGRIAVDSSSNRVFAVNEKRRSIQVLDPDASRIIDEIPLGVTPRSLVFDQAASRLYVVSAEAGALLAVDPATSSVVRRAAVGGRPVSITVDPSDGRLLVALEATSEVAVLDPQSLEEAARFPVGNGALGIAVDSSRRLAYVANTKDDSLSVLDLDKGQTTATIAGVGDGPEMVAVDEESHRIYVTSWYSGAVTVLE